MAEAERLVIEQDPEKIFALVRDRILTIPASRDKLGSYTERLFGTKATLRSGVGTLRDKADLLAELYSRAGFQASVKRVRVPDDPDFVRKVLVRTMDRAFIPDATDEQVQIWREVLGLPENASSAAILDADGQEAAALADALVSHLPNDAESAEFDFETTYMPVVEVSVGGEVRYANVAVPDIAFGEVGSSDTVNGASDANPLPSVRLTLSVVTTASPREPVELLQAEFKLEDVIGRSAYVSFVPPDDLLALATRSPSELEIFLPVIALRSPEMTEAEREANTRIGSAITKRSQVFEFDGDAILRNGNPINVDAPDAETLAEVASLDVTINATRFPDVSIRARALDADGLSVEGLSAASFSLLEDSAAQAFVLLENRAPAPRVLFILDKSSSLPDAFKGDAAALLVRNLAGEILDIHADAQFRVHAVGGNVDAGAWTSDLDGLEDAATTQTGLGSDLWLAMADGSKLGATTIVFITDGVATDEATRELLGSIAHAAPSVFIAVAGASEHLSRLAALTDGAVVSVSEQAEAIEQTLLFIAERRKSAYTFHYRAPESGASSRSVELRLASTSISTDGVYEVPATEARAAASRVGGILLSIQVGSGPEVVRVISGVKEIQDETPDTVFEEVENAWIGSTEVRFEGPPPTTAVIVDELLTTRLLRKPLFEAANSGSPELIADAFLKAPASHGAAGYALHAPLLPPEDGMIFPTGLRAVMVTTSMLSPRSIRRAVDVLPLGAYRAALPDRRDAFEAAIRSTARLALIESAFFDQSTSSLLAGEALTILLPNESIGAVVSGLSAYDQKRWELSMRGLTTGYRIVPANGVKVAFWHVDRDTGSLLGVIESGAGGGASVEQFEHDMNTMLDALDRFGSIAGYGGLLGTAAGTWYSLELTKARKLLAALVVIAGGQPDSDPSDWSDFGCNAAAGAAGGALDAAASSGRSWLATLGRIGSGAMSADDIASAATGESVIC